jgi:alpha-mannosidase
LPTRFSLASLADAGVLVETAKWAEDEDALILRFYEADGGATSVTVELGLAVEAVDQVDLLERNPRGLRATPSGSVRLDFRAREVKTVRVRLPHQPQARPA